MKDTAGPRKAIFKNFSEGLTQKHPKVFNILLILALISLVIAGALLLSDIMSFKSNASQKGPGSALYLSFPKEIQATIKNWQEKGSDLTDQLKTILGLKGPAKATVKDAANRDKGRALMVKNRLAKAKVARTIADNRSHQKNLTVPWNSSRNRTTVQPLLVASAIMMDGAESGSGSDSPSLSGEVSLKDIENKHRIVDVTSKNSENQIHSNESSMNESVSNESLLNESVSNESSMKKSVSNESAINTSFFSKPVLNESLLNETITDKTVTNKSAMDESVLNESVVDESLIRQSKPNQSQMYTNLTTKIPKSLLANDHESNSTRNNSSYPFIPRNTNLSPENLSSGSVALPQTQMNYAAPNSMQIHDSIAQDGNGSSASVPQEFNNVNYTIHNQNKSSNLKANNDSTQDEKVKNESQGAILDQRNNAAPGDLAYSLNGISANGVTNKTSNITSEQITGSLEGLPNSTPAVKPILANNSISQSQELMQNQTNNRNETKPALEGPSISLLPQSNNSTGKSQNLNQAVKNNKKVPTSSGSIKSQESKKSLTNTPNRFRPLKVPTPSWITKAESKNKK
jgi:hypothetical protein